MKQQTVVQVQQNQPLEIESNPVADVIEAIVSFILFLLILATFPLTISSCIIIVKEYERAVVFRLGRIKSYRPKAPGLYFMIPCMEEYRIVDLRVKTLDVPPQLILTRDSVSLCVDAVVFWRVFDPTLKVARVQNPEDNTKMLAQSTLRSILGTKTLAEVLADKNEIASSMRQALDAATDQWGIKINDVEITDIKLPPELQRAMAAEAEASREAKAKVVSANGEMMASKKLKEAADIMNDSPNAIQLRYLQTLTGISDKNNKTIIIPIPSNVIAALVRKKKDLRGKPAFKGRAGSLTSKL
uniref:band 7 protein AGAP004871-like n=1 Tax=Styela clava TaxID=7725 RepID=UPI00193A44D0|nr:band 7 protein AGAP004871-like [Styela clava]